MYQLQEQVCQEYVSHAHKIQAAVSMEQRAKAAGKSKEAAVFRRYINANKKGKK
jgi:hypothetical protein